MRSLIAVLLVSAARVCAGDLLSLSSPDGRARFGLSDRFEYFVQADVRTVVEPSPVAITNDAFS